VHGEGETSSQRAIWVALRKCELYERTCESTLAKQTLAGIRTAELMNTEFFSVEVALLESISGRLPPQNCIGLLLQALIQTESTGTNYQRCRVLLEMSSKLISLGKTGDARKRLFQAVALAQSYGYRPLEAKILLVGGSAETGNEKRISKFAESFQLASDMGLREIAGESAFRLGEEQLLASNLLNTREYLSRSVETIDQLAKEVSARARKSYLNVTWRRQARSRLGEVNEMLPRSSEAAGHQTREGQEGKRFFKAIYQTTTALGTADTAHDSVRTLNQIVGHTLKCGVVLMLTGDKVELHPSGLELDDKLSRRMVKLYETVGDQPFFESQDVDTGTGKQKRTIAWVPLSAGGSRLGGIYVDVGPRRFREIEIEFLTMLGVVSSNSLLAILHTQQQPTRVRTKAAYSGIVGHSREIEEVCAQIEIAARSPATVLIEGESGTGKELVARAIHQNSQRRAEPFVTVDCGAIPETLIESELFGSRRGSFTGATVDRAGLIESANKGTLFLDEIANTSPALQAKLLRVLQEREVRRVGDTRDRPVNIRLVSATNANLNSLVESGSFRQDLLFRLKVLHIQIPPLRNRRQDIPEIALAFLDQLNQANQTKKRFGRGVLDKLGTGYYNGNIRELQNVIERAYFSAADGNVIKKVEVESGTRHWQSSDEVESWFKDLTAGRKDFWVEIHARYKKRDISREKVVALMDLGLRSTRGSYKSVATLFHLEDREYRRFMDFLRRNKCQPDFRLYRKGAEN
jgi:transcriptional regulator with GAF, ATPase, and Fis domain